jgi:hypothetical protein
MPHLSNMSLSAFPQSSASLEIWNFLAVSPWSCREDIKCCFLLICHLGSSVISVICHIVAA